MDNKKNHKQFSREIWVLTGDKDVDYANMRQGLREMDVLKPAKSKERENHEKDI